MSIKVWLIRFRLVFSQDWLFQGIEMEHDDIAQSLMLDFANSTGLSGASGNSRRYLWTDAFAVCNYLGFFQKTGDHAFLDLAIRLVDQVHQHLAKHRRDSRHSGWLSGLPEEEARLHPTCAGLRIGKPMDERQPDEPPDEALEWLQDGQYFHYLTRWMYALNCVFMQTNNSDYHRWAHELAIIAHRAFVYAPEPGKPKQMYWKMSIDLGRPLVRSMGHHDPLDALVTYQQLESTANCVADRPARRELDYSLNAQIADFSAMCAGKHWATADELGIGSLLCTAYDVAQMIAEGSLQDEGLLEILLSDGATSLHSYAASHRLDRPAGHRLAFRELGLAIGIKAIGNIKSILELHPEPFKNPRQVLALVTALEDFAGLHGAIVNFWLPSPRREVRSWRDHADINNVMLATSLAPDGYIQGLSKKAESARYGAIFQ